MHVHGAGRAGAGAVFAYVMRRLTVRKLVQDAGLSEEDVQVAAGATVAVVAGCLAALGCASCRQARCAGRRRLVCKGDDGAARPAGAVAAVEQQPQRLHLQDKTQGESATAEATGS